MSDTTHPSDGGEHLLPMKTPPANQHGRFQLDSPAGKIEGWTNLDLTTFAGKARFLNCLSPADINFDKNGRAEILATSYLIFPDEGTDPETGEVKQFTRTVLVSKEGATYRTTSESAPRRLKAALGLWSAEQWAEGIPFVITERRSHKTQRTYHDLRVQE
jgi:hypothetical protein